MDKTFLIKAVAYELAKACKTYTNYKNYTMPSFMFEKFVCMGVTGRAINNGLDATKMSAAEYRVYNDILNTFKNEYVTQREAEGKKWSWYQCNSRLASAMDALWAEKAEKTASLDALFEIASKNGWYCDFVKGRNDTRDTHFSYLSWDNNVVLDISEGANGWHVCVLRGQNCQDYAPVAAPIFIEWSKWKTFHTPCCQYFAEYLEDTLTKVEEG